MKRTFAIALALSLTGIGAASSAHADTWRATHPRRAEVNTRLANQDRRIHNERREGELTSAQAHQLHAEDHSIRVTERADASAHNGHITTAEQAQLNQQENQVSHQIGH